MSKNYRWLLREPYALECLQLTNLTNRARRRLNRHRYKKAKRPQRDWSPSFKRRWLKISSSRKFIDYHQGNHWY